MRFKFNDILKQTIKFFFPVAVFMLIAVIITVMIIIMAITLSHYLAVCSFAIKIICVCVREIILQLYLHFENDLQVIFLLRYVN